MDMKKIGSFIRKIRSDKKITQKHFKFDHWKKIVSKYANRYGIK
jgi:hypothetical protein